MATTITAGNATNGAAIASDNTGILAIKTGTGAGTTALTLDASQNVTLAGTLQAASTSTLVLKNGVANTPPTVQDSAGTQIGTFCRSWVNFNGTGTVAIRASFNVSSITDNGTGDYTVNFTTAMPDANYAAQYMLSDSRQLIKTAAAGGADPTASAFRIQALTSAGSATDSVFNLLAFFR